MALVVWTALRAMEDGQVMWPELRSLDLAGNSLIGKPLPRFSTSNYYLRSLNGRIDYNGEDYHWKASSSRKSICTWYIYFCILTCIFIGCLWKKSIILMCCRYSCGSS